MFPSSALIMLGAFNNVGFDAYRSRGKGGKTPRTFSGVAKARREAKKAKRAH